MQSSDGQITLTLGESGSGKSTQLRDDLKSQTIDRVVIWDVEGNYLADRGLAGRRHRCLRDLFETLKRSPLSREIVQARRDDFAALLRWSFRVGRMLLVLEEMGAYTDAKDYPRQEIDSLAFMSRARSLDVVAVAQRPRRIPTNLVSQAKRFALYRIKDPADVVFLQQFLSLSDEQRARLPALGWGERLLVDKGFGATKRTEGVQEL